MRSTRKSIIAVERLFDRGLEFAVLLPKQSDSHYAGRNVVLGAADTPVFSYRPKGPRRNNRVVYADLAVHETEPPPTAPAAQPGPSERDFIEMLRVYSQWNGGRLPNALERTYALGSHPRRTRLPMSLRRRTSGLRRSGRKSAAAFLKLTRGMHFVDLLPKEADWHYAGKQVRWARPTRPSSGIAQRARRNIG